MSFSQHKEDYNGSVSQTFYKINTKEKRKH